MKVNNLNIKLSIKGDGKPFIWSHGLMGSISQENKTNWFQWKNFAQTIRLVRYDARGHGLSEGSHMPEDYQWSNLAKDMIGIADALKIDRFIAGGQSMGCATSLYAALLAPERTLGLVLAKPPTAWETRQDQTVMYDQTAEIVEARGVDFLAGLMKTQSLFPNWILEEQPKANTHYIESIKKFDDTVLAHVLRGAKLSDLPPPEDIKTIQVPALILTWVDDAMHPLSTAQELDVLLSESRLVIARDIDGVKAWPELIQKFVEGL